MLPATALDIRVAATCTRHQFTPTPATAIDQLRHLGSSEQVSPTIGRWIGYYDHPHRQALIDALTAAFPDSSRWIAAGAEMRSKPPHGTAGYSESRDASGSHQNAAHG